MLKIAMQIANMTEEQCTAENIQSIVMRCGYYQSMAGEERGFELGMFDCEGNLLVLTENDFHRNLKEKVFFPGDPNYNNLLWQEIGRIKKELVELFDSFIDDNVPFSKLEAICKEISPKVVFYAPGANEWDPQMGMTFDNRTLRNFVLSQEIIWPFFRYEGEQFKRVGRCPECGTYFFADNIRKMFCSASCKGHNFYRTKKEKEQDMAESVAETTRKALSKMNEKYKK